MKDGLELIRGPMVFLRLELSGNKHWRRLKREQTGKTTLLSTRKTRALFNVG